MRFLTLNINPSKYSHVNVSMLTDDERTKRINNLINEKDHDVIFFIEQWYPVFSGVQLYLEQIDYDFYKPTGFNWHRSYAGVIVAAKKKHTVTSSDGTGFVNETGKWLCVEIDSTLYLGVHYPQPGIAWNDFHESVERFSREAHPSLIIGDFNTPAGRKITIGDYRDVLPMEPTCATNKKLDYAFVKNGLMIEGEELINSVRMAGNKMLFSDHSATSVKLSMI